MLTENKKTALIITLTVSTLVIGIMPWLVITFRMHDFRKWLWAISFFKWCWLLTCFLAGFAIVLCWKHDNSLMKMIVTFFSIIALISALLWGLAVLIFSGGIPGL